MAAPRGLQRLGWSRKTGVVLPVVVGSARVEGVADSEFHGGGDFRSIGGFELRWLTIVFEVPDGSSRVRGEGWWYWLDWGGSARDESD